MENINSLGNLKIIEQGIWEINLPLFQRPTVVLFSNLFLVRTFSSLQHFFISHGSFFVEGTEIITKDYKKNEKGLYVMDDVVAGRFINNGEHSERIHINTVYIVPSNFEEEELTKLFNYVLIDMYKRI